MGSNNLLSFSLGRAMRELKNNRFMPVYAVEADPKTGMWIGDPVSQGELVLSMNWNAKENTSDTHYTTYIPEDNPEAMHALIIHWIW